MIKKKVKRGLIFIASLLFLSGIISCWELIRVNRATAVLLAASRGNIELSKDMLEAVQQQNTVLLLDIANPDQDMQKEFNFWARKFQHTIDTIKIAFRSDSSTYHKMADIEAIAQNYYAEIQNANGDLNLEWFVGVYSNQFGRLTAAIRDFMVLNENRIVNSANTVQGNAFRAAMIGIIALSAGILLVVLFYIMLITFFLNPVMRIEKSLRGYLDRSLPYDVETVTHDEIADLNANIKTLYERDRHTRRYEDHP